MLLRAIKKDTLTVCMVLTMFNAVAWQKVNVVDSDIELSRTVAHR